MSAKWKLWWKAAGVRAIKTMAETAIATIGAAAVLSAGGVAGGSVGHHPVRRSVPSGQRQGPAGSEDGKLRRM